MDSHPDIFLFFTPNGGFFLIRSKKRDPPSAFACCAAANHYAYIPCLNSTINGRARYCRSISISQDSEVGEKREVWSDPIESFCYNSISNQPDQDKAFITIPMTVFASSPCSNS